MTYADVMGMRVELMTVEEVRAQAKPTKLALMFGAHQIPFETVNEASGILCGLRDESGMGASQFGTQFAIVDTDNREVGYVTYNGKVWEGTRDKWQTAKLIFNPNTP